MNIWRSIQQRWRSLSITTKFTGSFGVLLILILLGSITGYAGLVTVRRAQTTILTSTEIQTTVLDMDRNLEKARRLQRDFFLQYPDIGVSAAYTIYALPASDRIAQVIRGSSELRRLLAKPEVSDALSKRDVDLNLYLSVSSRYATTFAESSDLVIELADKETGVQAHLAADAEILYTILAAVDQPDMIILYHKMRASEKDYLITHQRSEMQLALNIAADLEQSIRDSGHLTASQQAEALTYIDRYRQHTTRIVELDAEIQAKLQDFELGAESVDPISAELITLANNEVDRARTQIDRTYQLAFIMLIIAGVTGLVFISGVAAALNNSVTRNVVKLTLAVEKMQVGKRDVQVHVNSQDELGKLAHAFNDMSTQVRQTMAELERSENRFRSIVESVPIGMIMYELQPDDRLVLIEANPAAVELLKLDKAQIIGQEFEQVFPPLSETALPARLRAIAEGDDNWRVAEIVYQDEKVTGIFEYHAFRISAHQITVAFQEITERKHAENEIARRSRDLALLNRVIAATSSTLNVEEVLMVACRELALAFDLSQAAAALFDTDRHTAIVVAEYLAEGRPTALGVTIPITDNLSTQYVIKHRAPLVIDDTHHDPRVDVIKSMIVRREIASLLILPLIIQDEVIGTIGLDSLTPHTFTPEEVKLAASATAAVSQALHNARLYEELTQHSDDLEQAVRDRTSKLTNTNQRLERAIEELRALGQIKDDFVSNVSHELRTPITNLKLRHDLIKAQPGRIDVHLPVIQRETQRLSRIIDDLLELSRMDQQRTVVRFGLIDLNRLTQQYVADRESLAIEKNLSLHFEGASDLPLVHADEGLLGQALSIVLTNALHYTPAGGNVRVRTKRHTSDHLWIGIDIEDTGPGIPPEEYPRLFERFFRGKTGRESGAPGTGLGLALLKEIVDRHQGRVDVTSNTESDPTGTTFTIWLPLELPSETDMSDLESMDQDARAPQMVSHISD